MSDEKKPSTVGGVTKLLATFGTALIMFFAGVVWRAYEKSDDALRQMSDRLKALEEDKSKWGTLTELHNKTIAMEIEMSRLSGVMQGFSLAVQGGMVEKPTVNPVPPTVRPVPPAPPLADPRELFKDAEDYRKQQQQKYPLPPTPQKK